MSFILYTIPNYDNEPHAEDKHERFMTVLKAHSENQSNPFPEWELQPMKTKHERSKCICSHPIDNNYFISNNTTNTTLVVGSDCMKRFLNPSLYCKDCDCVIQNVVQRIDEKDYICRSCKASRKQIAKKYASWIFYHPGPHFQDPFHKVIEDEDYVETLLRLPYSFPKNKSLEAFLKYVNAVFYIEMPTCPSGTCSGDGAMYATDGLHTDCDCRGTPYQQFFTY